MNQVTVVMEVMVDMEVTEDTVDTDVSKLEFGTFF